MNWREVTGESHRGDITQYNGTLKKLPRLHGEEVPGGHEDLGWARQAGKSAVAIIVFKSDSFFLSRSSLRDQASHELNKNAKFQIRMEKVMSSLEPPCAKERLFKGLDSATTEIWWVRSGWFLPSSPGQRSGPLWHFFPTTDHSGGNYKRGQGVVLFTSAPLEHVH